MVNLESWFYGWLWQLKYGNFDTIWCRPSHYCSIYGIVWNQGPYFTGFSYSMHQRSIDIMARADAERENHDSGVKIERK